MLLCFYTIPPRALVVRYRLLGIHPNSMYVLDACIPLHSVIRRRFKATSGLNQPNKTGLKRFLVLKMTPPWPVFGLANNASLTRFRFPNFASVAHLYSHWLRCNCCIYLLFECRQRTTKTMSTMTCWEGQGRTHLSYILCHAGMTGMRYPSSHDVGPQAVSRLWQDWPALIYTPDHILNTKQHYYSVL